MESQAISGQQFFVTGMSCTNCNSQAAEQLGKIDDVLEAHVHFNNGQATLTAERTISRNEIRRSLSRLGFEAWFPEEPKLLPLSAEEKAGLDSRVASRGKSIRIKNHLTPGKITLFDYYAEWCGPCHLLSPKLKGLLLKYKNLALRKVDIKDWGSDAEKQATKKFKLSSLPYIRVYGQRGEILGSVQGNQIEEVEKIIENGDR